MKPKASEMLSVKTCISFDKNMDIFFIGPMGKSNEFDTKEEAQALIDEWDRVDEYKAKIAALEVENSGLKQHLTCLLKIKKRN